MSDSRFFTLIASSLLATLLSASGAVSVLEDFEGSTAGSGTPPAGWSLVTIAGAPSYSTSAAAQGSDESGGSTGLAGEVSSTDFLPSQVDLPGAFLTPNVTFDLTGALNGTFDFQILQEGTFDDVVFALGAIADGFDATVAGELLSVKMAEASSGGVAGTITNGASTRLNTVGTILTDDTWYRATVSWTPTSGSTGTFSLTVNNFSSDVYTLTATGYTFDSADAQIGFGSVNDTIRFDNVDFTGIPEPTAPLLLALSAIGFALRRRR